MKSRRVGSAGSEAVWVAESAKVELTFSQTVVGKPVAPWRAPHLGSAYAGVRIECVSRFFNLALGQFRE
jgi:hypothetical protein